MTIAIMQPYFLPYLGYFQMLNAVDKFVLLDDVNFIMKGYINKNSILVNNKPYKFTIPLKQASQNKLINEMELNFHNKDKQKLLKTIEFAYKKAPFYNDAMQILEQIIYYNEDNLVKYIYNSLKIITEYINISTEILFSSQIKKDDSLTGQNRIIEINKKLHANTYINAIGGKSLYSSDEFKKNNIDLNFIKMDNIEYAQFSNTFTPYLSFIDIIMFNTIEDIKKMLLKYTLEKGYCDV